MPSVRVDALRLLRAPVNGMAFRPVRPDEVGIAVRQFLEAFGVPGGVTPGREEQFNRALHDGHLWGVDGAGRLLGHCRLQAVDHMFGGRPVRCMEVVGVAVPEAHRRAGVATAMLEGATSWGTHQNLGMSLLFPAVPQLYRRLGWELAGTLPRTALPGRVALAGGEPMRPAVGDDLEAIAACHDRYIASLSGPGRRSGDRWQQLLSSKAAHVLDGGDGIEAYVFRSDGAAPGQAADAPDVIDWAATTPRGQRAVLAHLARDPEARAATICGPLPDTWTLATDTWQVPQGSGLHWMARALVARTAVAQRGFPAGVDAAVTFEVDDRVVVDSRGPWRLEVTGGRGALTPARTADIVLDARALGPLFTGFRTAGQLARAALLDGPEGALDTVTTMFAGPPPVLLDFF